MDLKPLNLQLPKLNIVEGKLEIPSNFKVDSDKDGKPSVEHVGALKVDLVEVISEIARKDIGWLEAVIKKATGG